MRDTRASSPTPVAFGRRAGGGADGEHRAGAGPRGTAPKRPRGGGAQRGKAQLGPRTRRRGARGSFALAGALTQTSGRRCLSRRSRVRRRRTHGQLGRVGSVGERRLLGGLRGPKIGASTASIARGVTPVSRSTARERTSLSILSRWGDAGSCSSRSTKRFSCVRRRADAKAKFVTSETYSTALEAKRTKSGDVRSSVPSS
jgi:hypothetical protein